METSFRNLIYLFPIVVTLHNAEEGIWFPGWSRRVGLGLTVSSTVIRFAASVLAVLAFVVTYLGVQSGKQAIWTYVAFGYMVAMLANVFVPHVAASVALRRYTPGVVTAVALNLPVLSVLVLLALREGYVSGWPAAAYSVGVASFLLLSIAALLKLGKVLGL